MLLLAFLRNLNQGDKHMSNILTFEDFYRYWISRIAKFFALVSAVLFFFMLVLSSSNLLTERLPRELNFYDLMFSYMSLVFLGALSGFIIIIGMSQFPKYFNPEGDMNE